MRTRGLVAGLVGGTFALAACIRPATAPGARSERGGPKDRPASAAPSASSPSPTIRYELAHDPTAACWRVRLRATGIDAAAGGVRLVLEDWGEWTDVDAYYLREFRVRPNVRPDPDSRSRFSLDPPPDWDGTLEAEYVLPLARSGSHVQQSKGLLPTHDDCDASGFSINTLFDVSQGEKRLDAVRTIRFVAPPDATIATGWGGVSTGLQEVRFHHPIDNVPLVFGRATGLSTAEADGSLYEIAQFGSGADRTADVLRIARALVPLYGRHAGRRYDEPVRLFLTPLASGGTHTDHGCIVGYAADELDAGFPPESIRVVAHELFHHWLGGLLDPPDDESLVWLHEGFTEYFTYWHVAASGLLGREWFAERLAASDDRARESEAFGRVAFADPKVRWRDGDGSNETLGYQGGAMLAFFADLELRRQGRAGLMQLVADLLREGDGRLTLPAFRAWMESHGLAAFYASYVAQPAALPKLEPALREIGFEPFEREANLTYLGIQVESGDSPGRIVALDPDGPAARAGFPVGDRIFGTSPTRSQRPRVADQVTTPYRFGLNRIATGAKVAHLDVQRGGEELVLSIEPRIIPGGTRTAYRARGEATERFFRYDPAQGVR